MHKCQNIYFCHHLNNIIVLHICIPRDYNLKPQINLNYSSQTCSHSVSLSRFGISEACSNLVAASAKRTIILADIGSKYQDKRLRLCTIFCIHVVTFVLFMSKCEFKFFIDIHELFTNSFCLIILFRVFHHFP